MESLSLPLVCQPPFWGDGQISECVRQTYLGTLIPLAMCGVSLLVLAFSCTAFRHGLGTSRGYQRLRLTTDEDAPQHGVLCEPSQYTIPPPLFSAIESLALLVDISLGIGILASSTSSDKSLPSLAAIFLSAYLSVLLLWRSYTAQKGNHRLVARLWAQSATISAVHWFCLLLTLLGRETSPADTSGITATIVHLGAFSLIVLLHVTTPRTVTEPTGKPQHLKPSREQTASLLSRLTFSWLGSLVWKAFRTSLETTDLYLLNEDESSSRVDTRYRTLTTDRAALLWRLFQLLKGDILRQGAWALLLSMTVFVPATLLGSILRYLETPDIMQTKTAWLCVFVLLISGVITGVAECQCQWLGAKLSTRLRAILLSEIYAKVLRKRMVRSSKSTSPSQSGEESHASDGHILNLTSADVEKISMIGGSLYMAWVNFPVQIAIALYLLYRTLGISGPIGVALMVALLPLNGMLSRKAVAAQGKVLSASDARIHSSTEVLNNIRTIKFCAWETAYINRVLSLRDVELKKLRTNFVWWSINMTVFHALPFMVTTLTFFVYTIVFGNELGTSTAFPALAMFGVIRIPLDRMSATINFLLQAHVSILRIDAFLREKESAKNKENWGTGNSLELRNASLKWPASLPSSPPSSGQSTPRSTDDQAAGSRFQLQNLNITFREHSLNLICGPSGSGKSSLLLALLGEMELVDGTMVVPPGAKQGTAYCPQEPWILNQSIRSNILLGLPFESRRYGEVLDAVALPHDLALLDEGDQTLAGENGSRLSGGQKQRVALARALYSTSEYILLDDCLSAIDARTANHIFFSALLGPLMRGRTCVLATHHVGLAVPHAGNVILLENGKAIGQGTQKELIAAGLMNADMGTENRDEGSTPASESGIGESPDLRLQERTSSTEAEVPTGNGLPPKTDRVHKESKREGAVTWSILRGYLSAMGSYGYWAVVLSGFVAQQLAALGTNLWVKEWAHQYDAAAEDITLPESPETSSTVNACYYLAIYAAISLGYMLISFLRDGITFYGSLRASSSIYQRMLDSIVHAKLTFFDHVPLGQIVNRFSKDILAIDQQLASFMISELQLLVSIVMVVLLICTIIPAFLPAAVMICAAYYCVLAVYVNSSRDLKRIQSVERSPLYQQLGETLSGYVSIRAYNRMEFFTAANHDLIDRFHRPSILLSAGNEWLILRIGALSAFISFLTGAFILWGMGTITPGTAGLVLTYAATFTENVMWLAQVYAIIQQNLNSVERIAEYTEVDQEYLEPRKKAAALLPAQWPARGGVEFAGYTTRYAPELGPVLKDISFEAEPGRRVAIVGRTGAGKSTLALALIRGLEAEEGRIEIDGVDIASLSLERLRQAVTVVPQDPTLFSGSIRDNLDPVGQHTEEEILSILRTVRLSESVDENASSETAERSFGPEHPAEALSRGQRQLLCIARALLRRSRVLVLDEATASIDHGTDALIQESLRASIAAGTTVLTIAHRLQSIAEYDWVVVMDAGRVVQQGTVLSLLGQDQGAQVFRRLCEESGDLENIRLAAVNGR